MATPRSDRQCRRDTRLGGKPKKRFETQAEALDEINGGPGLNAYKCDLCDYYHIGHVPGTKFGDPIEDPGYS